MKKTRFLTLFAASLLMVVVACKPTEDPLSHFTDGVHVTTADIPFVLELYTHYAYYYLYTNSIEAYGYVHSNKPEVIDEVGFCYSNTNEFPQYESDFFVVAGTSTGTWYDFESHLYDLSASSKYYIRPYARYMTDSIRYGNVEEVYTY